MKVDLDWAKKLPVFLKRYRYPALILLLGLGLMLWPFHSKEKDQPVQALPVQTEVSEDEEAGYRKRMESELAKILSEIDGAGQVRVMLTLRYSKTAQYQTNEESQT